MYISIIDISLIKALTMSTQNSMHQPHLFPTQRLLDLLANTTKNPKAHILYEYILAYNEFLGSSQDILINIADRLGFSLSLERYKNVPNNERNEGITLREVMYYELWYYLKYAEPNLKKQKLPSTAELINLDYDEYKKVFKKLYPKGDYDMEKYQYRLSLVTDSFYELRSP